MRSVYELLRAKRDGQELTREEIAGFVRGVVDGSIPDYQTAAFLMASVIRGSNAGSKGIWNARTMSVARS